VKGLYCFLGLNILDSLVTWRAITSGAGIEVGWYRFLQPSMPIWAILLVKTALVGLIAISVYKHRRPLFKSLNVGMGLIVGVGLVTILLEVI
jgi:hypothetical protein